MEDLASKARRQRISDFLRACEAKDQVAAIEVLKEAFTGADWTEWDLAMLCTAAYDMRVHLAFLNTIEEYLTRFPQSLYPVPALRAAILAEQSDFETATEEARHYWSRVKQAGYLHRLNEHVLLQHGFAQCVLPATALYTELGWRSYSKRILNAALQLDEQFLPPMKEPWKAELATLDRELAESEDHRTLDAKWEAFYARGEGAEALAKIATERKFENFARRISLLESELRYGKTLEFETEFYKSVYGMQQDGKISYFLK